MTIQEMNASEDGKNMTVLASDPSNGMTIVRFWNIILHAISTSKQTSNYTLGTYLLERKNMYYLTNFDFNFKYDSNLCKTNHN